ncbi:MAG TPA: MarR family transcriptional regulator [Frankiaceae bacterium]|jgi:DNA-binding MarR family transcriptional regulator|nr:MarR family transcriptional regulator [Frankiaceae bacterium]
MTEQGKSVAAAEVALERLFRLTVSRQMDTRQAAAVGAVVTRAGYALLRILSEATELAVAELARRCSMDPAACGRQLQALDREGLITRTAGAEDGRVIVVKLTEAGRNVYQRIVAVRNDHMEQVLVDWPEADREALAALVGRLVDDLKATPFRPIKEQP